VVTGGHPFDRDPFFEVFDSIDGLAWTHLRQPEAAEQLLSEAESTDVVVFYDMPGIEFTRSDPPVVFAEPSADAIAQFEALLDRGVPLVFLHHAIAGWPTWDAYAEVIGGRFHYAPARFRGIDYPASGYRFDVEHHVEVLDPDHPICDGLDPVFTITDELYQFPVNEVDVHPIMRSRAGFTSDEFYSADLAIRGERESRRDWTHPEGSSLVAWTKRAGNSPVAYIQFGDSPATYADANYRRVIGNALRWATGQSEAG